MNNNLNSFASQLNRKLKSFAVNAYIQLVELNDAVNKVAKTVDAANYEYITIDDTISAMKTLSNKFLNQVYSFGANSDQVSNFIKKMKGMENKVGQLLKQDQPSDIFYFQFSNFSHALNRLTPNNIAKQKQDAQQNELSPADKIDRDFMMYPDNPYAGQSSNPIEFNAEMEKVKEMQEKELQRQKNITESPYFRKANKKSKLTKEASNIRNTQILKAIKSVLNKWDDDQDLTGGENIEYYIRDLPPEAKEQLVARLATLKGSEDGFLRALQQANEAFRFLEELEKAINDYEHEKVYDGDLRYYQESILNDENLDRSISIRDEDDLESDLED